MRATRTGVTGLSKRRDGRYRLDLVYLASDGTHARVTKLFRSGLSKTAIAAQAKIIANDAMSGRRDARKAAAEADAAKRTIAELAPEVIGHRKTAGGSPATLAEFSGAVDGRIVPMLGDLAPHELTSAELAKFVDDLKADECSPLRIRNVMKVLGRFIKIVRVRELDPLLRANPVREAFELGLELPSPERTEEPVHLSLPEARKLLRGKAPPERRARYALAFLTGLRDGEIAGLRWEDVAGGLVRVRFAVATVGNGKPGPLKTPAAKRDVPMHPALAGYLKAWRAAWTKAIGQAPKGTDPVFASPRRGPESSLRHYRPKSAEHIQTDLAAVGIKRPEVDFHATRRSFSTWLEAAGVHPETVDRLLGHVPKSVRARHYSAPDLGVLREAVERIAWA
jgi:integrase